MSQQSKPDTTPHQLRAQAEAALQSRMVDIQDYSSEDIQRLVYELQVHQIELELQNEALQKTQQKYEELYRIYVDLYESAPVGYFTIDENSKIVEANQAGLNLLGATKKSVIGRRLSRFIHPEQQDDFHWYCRSLLQTDQIEQMDLRIIKEDGTLFYASLEGRRVSPDETQFSDQSQPGRWCKLVVSDITERTQMKADLQGMYDLAHRDAETKELLLKELNHRVRNNLTMLIGMIDFEEKRGWPKNKEQYVARLNRLKAQIYGFAVVHRLLSASHWEPFSLAALVEKVLTLTLELLSTQHNIAMTVSSSPVMIPANEANLMALIINELTTNALKHAFQDQATGQITVTITETETQILLEFKDNGPGFPDEVLNFSRYNTGWKLMQVFVEDQLQGKVKLFNQDGAVVHLFFPVGIFKKQS